MADADKRRNLKQQAITGEFNLQTDVGEICAPPARTASQTCGAYGRTPRDFNTFPVGPDCARPNSFTVADSARPHRNGAVPTGGGIPPGFRLRCLSGTRRQFTGALKLAAQERVHFDGLEVPSHPFSESGRIG